MTTHAPLHVTNGDVVAEVIEAIGLEGETLVWADVLHVGPLEFEPGRSRPLRARYLAESGWGPASVVESLAEAGLVATVDRRPLPPAPPQGRVENFASTLLTLTESGRVRV